MSVILFMFIRRYEHVAEQLRFKHIWKVNHSQTNNRIERFYETFQSNMMYTIL